MIRTNELALADRARLVSGFLDYARHPACDRGRNLPTLIRLGNQVLAIFRLAPLPAGWPEVSA
jgi:hypothetical protein